MRAMRSLATFILAPVVLVMAASSSGAVDSADWQSGDVPVRVTTAGSGDPLPEGVAIEATSFANGPAGYYLHAGNAYYFDGSAVEEGGPDGSSSGRGFRLHLTQVVAEDGTSLTEWQQEQVCAGGAAQWTKLDAPLPAIDLASLGELAQLIDDGVVVPSDEWTGDRGWNPNLDGLIWHPASYDESIDFVDTRYEGVTVSTEWNLNIQLNVTTAGAPSWRCSVDGTGPGEPVAQPEPADPGSPAQPSEVVPPTVVAAEVPVVAGGAEQLPVAADQMTVQPVGFAANTEVIELPELTPLRLLIGALGVGLLWRAVRRRVWRSR